MDMRTISSVCDWFVLVSARSTPGIKAVIRAIDEGLSREGVKYLRREGQYEQRWVVLDYGDVVIHAFLPEIRGFYGLETLWKDIPREEYDDKCVKKTSRKRSETSP
ncbi:MAG: ribosome silencing factor [Candidatus Omnitrophica bacterium]|nr:ribosome silencing factor [Candidatus Omnitrophota bacterium]